MNLKNLKSFKVLRKYKSEIYGSVILCEAGLWVIRRSIAFQFHTGKHFLLPNSFLLGHSRPLFLFFLSYQQLTVNTFIIKSCGDWIWTSELWYWKRPLCQLSHNHFLQVVFRALVWHSWQGNRSVTRGLQFESSLL